MGTRSCRRPPRRKPWIRWPACDNRRSSPAWHASNEANGDGLVTDRPRVGAARRNLPGTDAPQGQADGPCQSPRAWLYTKHAPFEAAGPQRSKAGRTCRRQPMPTVRHRHRRHRSMRSDPRVSGCRHAPRIPRPATRRRVQRGAPGRPARPAQPSAPLITPSGLSDLPGNQPTVGDLPAGRTNVLCALFAPQPN